MGENVWDGEVVTERAVRVRVIKTFDSVESLGDRFESEVFQDISSEMLYVYHKPENQWYQYRWAPGRREITLMGKSSSELPIVIQVYP